MTLDHNLYRRSIGLLVVFVATLTCGTYCLRTSHANKTIPLDNLTVRTSNVGGAVELEADTLLYGDVKVYLPDDMQAGDTISGTVVAKPIGSTPEEKQKNLGVLEGLVIEIGGKTISPKQEFFTIQPSFETAPLSIAAGQTQTIIVTIRNPTNQAVGRSTVPLYPVITFDPPRSSNQPPQNLTAPANPTSNFNFPRVGQQGRPLEVFGPFDGNASNTTLRFGPTGTGLQDFEKNTENVSGGFGLIRPLAESPRKVVFRSPADVTGPVSVLVKEGNATAVGTTRNLGVHLSAPKTNLMRGERTTLTVEVVGLQGIQKDVPLQLDSKGVINMDGGNFQNLRIKPTEITPDGRYTTNRTITGVQAGGFTVTATVIVRRFDSCLQDDSDPNRIFHFNTFTGDYVFACGGACGQPKRPGGTVQPGGTIQPGGTTGGTPPPVTPPTGGLNLTGTGKLQMKGCIITLSHNAPDRRVFARLDTCNKTGDANVQTTSPKTNIDISDKNSTDNTAPSPPPK